jgi:aconitate hydratase
MNRKSLKLDGSEIIHIPDLNNHLTPSAEINVTIEYSDGRDTQITLLSRIDTQNEIEYYRHGGILQFVLRNMIKK